MVFLWFSYGFPNDFGNLQMLMSSSFRDLRKKNCGPLRCRTTDESGGNVGGLRTGPPDGAYPPVNIQKAIENGHL